MSDFDVEKLLKQISELEAELKSARKYGLVWDKESAKETVVEMCEKTIQTLKEKNSLGCFQIVLLQLNKKLSDSIKCLFANSFFTCKIKLVKEVLSLWALDQK